jgi:hypothetical protein
VLGLYLLAVSSRYCLFLRLDNPKVKSPIFTRDEEAI